MRVLQVARYGSVRGGAETYIASLAAGLRDAGHAVALAYGIEPDTTRAEVRDGFQIPGLVEGGVEASADDARALTQAIESFAPDVVHVHLPDVPWVAPLAASLAPTLLAVHDHRLDCPVGTRYWAAWKRTCTIEPGPVCLAYNLAAHCGSLRANLTLRPYRSWRGARAAAASMPIQVFSGYMASMVSRSGVERVTVTPYPVPPAAEPRQVDAPMDRRPVVLASGRLNKEKGFHQLIAAMEQVSTPAHLVIVGDGHERRALEHRASNAGGRHRITFTGWLSGGELASWRARAKVVAVPSMWPEPFGIVGLEAMAAGVPVVAFDAGGIAEWLADGETGSLVPVGDTAAFAAAVQALLADPEERARMGEAARARAEGAFGLKTHVERVENLYAMVRT